MFPLCKFSVFNKLSSHQIIFVSLSECSASTWSFAVDYISTVKCRCNERQYNEMFRIAKLFLGPFPFPYLMCVKTFHFNEFSTFGIMN